MGWSSWNYFFFDINETLFFDVARAMATRGYKQAGYEYVNIDAGYLIPGRDATGRLQPNPELFPSGIKALADYVHSLGLKLGYTPAHPGRAVCWTCSVKGQALIIISFSFPFMPACTQTLATCHVDLALAPEGRTILMHRPLPNGASTTSRWTRAGCIPCQRTSVNTTSGP